jgi:hypothetical protein
MESTSSTVPVTTEQESVLVSNQEESKIVTKVEETKKKNGLKLFGYVFPWWVVVVVCIIALYMLNERGVFNGLKGETVIAMKEKDVLKINTDVLNTPQEAKRLFRGIR